jgi:DNA helicase HerA-like ATPase
MAKLLIGQTSDGKQFTIDPSSLTKHTVVFGATGSGKTVLCKSIMEEASSRGIPVLAVDPKGDIGCLAIRSENFSFRPFSDNEAKLLGKTPEDYSKELADHYRDSYNALARDDDELNRFVEKTEVRIFTPRSSTGLPVSMSPRLTPPKDFVKKMGEDPSLAFDMLELKASNLLRLAGYTEDGKIQRSLISTILEDEWKSGHELTLEKLIELVSSPPFERLGMLPLDDAISKRERSELSRRLNVLVTDAAARAWFLGEPPDFDRWFHKSQGRTPINIVDLRTIPSEEGKQVFVEYLLQELFYWINRREGTQTLQYLLYFDEIHGYCPPIREPPSKKILMHLIHVSRAYGLGIVMATQNPVDVDYKVISNANFRFIGNLSTRQDIERVRTGLSLGADAFQVISGLKARQFYYQIFDQGESGILSPRWLMSYHRGPLEPLEIKRLKEGAAPEKMTVKAAPLAVPEEVFLRDTDRKRAKKGILGGTEEKIVFAKKIFLPYLDFTYRFPAEKGLLSKQTVISEGRSTVLALREANFGFDPRLVELAPMLANIEEDSAAIVAGIDSTVLVSERLDELKNLLRDYEVQSEERSKQYEALPKESPTRESLKENIEFLRKTKLLRWKMFADGLQLPAKLDLDKLELLDGTLFYMPYFITKLSRGGEARYIVWNREGREDDTIADEMTKNKKFRTLIETHALPQTV